MLYNNTKRQIHPYPERVKFNNLIGPGKLTGCKAGEGQNKRISETNQTRKHIQNW